MYTPKYNIIMVVVEHVYDIMIFPFDELLVRLSYPIFEVTVPIHISIVSAAYYYNIYSVSHIIRGSFTDRFWQREPPSLLMATLWTDGNPNINYVYNMR